MWSAMKVMNRTTDRSASVSRSGSIVDQSRSSIDHCRSNALPTAVPAMSRIVLGLILGSIMRLRHLRAEPAALGDQGVVLGGIAPARVGGLEVADQRAEPSRRDLFEAVAVGHGPPLPLL